MHNQRHHFFVDKAFQTRYGVYVALTLLVVCAVSFVGLYFGIWGSIIESFSDEEVLHALATASRMQEYQNAREPVPVQSVPSSLRLFKEVHLLSARQREILSEILRRSHTKLVWQCYLLILCIAFGSIYLTHKVAGPFYRLRISLKSIQSGDLTTRIHLRKYDEGKQAAEAFNETANELDRRISHLKETVRTQESAQLKQTLEAELDRFKTTFSS